MAKDPGEKTKGSGLELDKINLSSIASGNARKPMHVGDPAVGSADPAVGGRNPVTGATSQKPSPQVAENMPQNKKKSNLTILSALAILSLIMALAVFFKQQDFSLNFLSGESGPSQENYLRVGPVTATLANDDIVKFSIDIDCKNADLKEQLAGKDTQIRDKIIAVLTAPGTEEMIKKHDYEAVKAEIKKNLGDLGGAVDDIYFAELLMY